MYSGLVLTKYSGRIMGTHQKIDRVARKHLAELLGVDSQVFPSIGEILRFEGKNGPDGIKRKSPSKNEPWHFLNPLAEDNTSFMSLIDNHYKGLSDGLRKGDREQSSFQAAWLSHAIVDGLTPAHHYPYEEKLAELRVDGNDGRDSIKGKLIFEGNTAGQTILNTLKAYAPGGLLTSHVTFEQGIALLIKPLSLSSARPTEKDFEQFQEWDYKEYFLNKAKEVAVLDIFEEYLHHGWTTKLTNKVRKNLLPTLVKAVTMLWYGALIESGIFDDSKKSIYENNRRQTKE